MEDSLSQGKYYVYTLAYPDGTVFYVGKGTGSRIDRHEKEARSDKPSYNPYKCRIIRKIWDEGGQVLKQKIAFYDREEDAFKAEIALIAFYGKDTLTNLTEGGEGAGEGNQFHRQAPEGEEGFNFGVSITGAQRAILKQLLLKQGIEPTKGTITSLAKTIMSESIKQIESSKNQ